MTIHVPVWLIQAVLALVYLLSAYMTAVVRAINGNDTNERPITAILIALCWPVLLVTAIAKELWRKPL